MAPHHSDLVRMVQDDSFEASKIRKKIAMSMTKLEAKSASIGRRRKKREVIVVIGQSVRSVNFGPNFVFDEGRTRVVKGGEARLRDQRSTNETKEDRNGAPRKRRRRRRAKRETKRKCHRDTQSCAGRRVTEREERGGEETLGYFAPNQGWVRARPSCREHLWMTGMLAGCKTAVAMFYMWTGRTAKERNSELWECLRVDIGDLHGEYHILLMGDFNAHLDSLDGPWMPMARSRVETHNGACTTEAEEEKAQGGQTTEVQPETMVGPECTGCNQRQKGRVPQTSDGDESPVARAVTEEPMGNLQRQEEGSGKLDPGEASQRGPRAPGRSETKWSGDALRKFWRHRHATPKQLLRHPESEVLLSETEAGTPGLQFVAAQVAAAFGREEGDVDEVEGEPGTEEVDSHEWLGPIGEAELKNIVGRIQHSKKKDGLKGLTAAFGPLNFPLLPEETVWFDLGARAQKQPREQKRGTKAAKGAREQERGSKRRADKMAASAASPMHVVEAAADSSAAIVDALTMRLLTISEESTVTGVDRFPASLLKKLGPRQCLALRECFSEMQETGEILRDWRHGRMTFLCKGAKERSRLSSYRPITVTSVLYRFFAQVLRRRIQAWPERKRILGELQNGFRRGRRLDDNLFVLTQCIEMARTERRELWVASSIWRRHTTASTRLHCGSHYATKDFPGEWWISYENCTRVRRWLVEWHGMRSGMVPIGRGLRQGCPLSPLLFMLFLSKMEAGLEGCGHGFGVSFMLDGRKVSQTLPGLLYADDIVLTASSRPGLQKLLDTCTRHGDRLGLRLRGRTESEPVTLAREEQSDRVRISLPGNYLAEYDQGVREKALRGQRVLKAKALWSFNRLEVIRGLWKAVTVPGRTFANAVLCSSAATREYLERRQREVGRLALGAHGTTPNEAVQGDVGWSSFEAREAVAKLSFEVRAWDLGQERWVHKMQRCLLYTGAATRWTRRVCVLSNKYGVPLPSINRLEDASIGLK
ncbi:hypothetical protein HPB47_008081 [Ixodes persulcatus]|uniref:Uncharacterized protein n=1 Tax=Ixodes persulcatus TaxID=34615 RepID=A0AC60P612_IXOPE|nr:hypothetical protein HPB47_008081 [Ixodes persulcatus]